MSATLIRQSDGRSISLDCLVEAEVVSSWTVAQHTVEVDDATVTQVSDHVQRLAGTITLSAIQTERPATGEGGPDYIRRLIDWLESAGGELLDVAIPDRPTQRGYVLQSAPWRVRRAEDLPVSLTLTQVRRVVSQLVDGPAVQRSTRRPRRDVAAASAATVDLGEGSTSESPLATQSILRALIGGR